jgi:hypothetical protein
LEAGALDQFPAQTIAERWALSGCAEDENTVNTANQKMLNEALKSGFIKGVG